MEFKVYVGNLPYRTTEEDMKQFFGTAGNVVDARIIRDKETNRSKGFGFVSFDSEEGVNKAIETLNGKEFGDRPLKVDRAKARENA